MKMRLWAVVGSLAIVSLAACGGSGSNTLSDASFPTDLSVSSPLDVTTDASAFSLSKGFVPRYTWATARIDALLSGATPAVCTFDPDLFLTTEINANCFGPGIGYTNHPNGGLPNSGTFPGGDLGLWTETDTTTGHACSAAQLNSRMEAVRDRSTASLNGLASLICTLNTSGYSMPVNSTQDLLAEMNALGISGVTFTAASIAHSNASGSSVYSYSLRFSYTSGSTPYDIVVAMEHTPGATTGAYTGKLSYRFDSTAGSTNCSSSDVTTNGSLLYDRSSTTAMSLESRSAIFCGHGVNGLDANGAVDRTAVYNAATNPDGWADNFNIFTANYDPSTLIGNYAFSWQAGFGDSNSRVFNVVASATTAAKAFYGYGDDITTTTGDIKGFICNWAGLGGGPNIQNFTQYQEVEFNSSTGKFDSVTANLVYAPTNSCAYDGSGSFTYDSDGNGTIDTVATDPVVNDLLPVVDADSNNILDEIAAAGFVTPTL